MTGPLSKSVPPDTFKLLLVTQVSQEALPKDKKQEILILPTLQMPSRNPKKCWRKPVAELWMEHLQSLVWRSLFLPFLFSHLSLEIFFVFVVVILFVLLKILKFIPKNKVHNQLIWFLFPGGKFMDSETNKDNKFSAALKNCPKEANLTSLKWTANTALCCFTYNTPTCGVFSWPTHLEPC